MISIPRTAILIGLLLILPHRAMAEIITFNVHVTQTSINLGQSVDWQIFATVSSSTASNLGIATIALDLVDNLGGVLTPGTIGPQFADYDSSSGGTAFGGNLIDINAFQFAQNGTVVEGGNTSSLGPLLLASGSFTPTSVGAHTLTATGDSYINSFFSPGSPTTTTPFSVVNSGSDTFTVNAAAVPEPSTLLFLSAATLIAGTRYGRFLKKSNRSPSSRSGE